MPRAKPTNDEEMKRFIELRREAVMAHYYRNREAVKERVRGRYYAKSGRTVPPPKVHTELFV